MNIKLIKGFADNWWLVLIQGILFLCLGLLLAFNPIATILVMVQILAFYWIFSGAISIISSFSGEIEGSRLWSFIGGLIGMIAGGIMAIHPYIAAAVTTTFWMYFMGFASILYGAALVFGRFSSTEEASESSWGNVLLGIFNFIFGLLVLAFPIFAAEVYVVVAGAFAIISGISLTIVAFRLRGINKKIEDKNEPVQGLSKELSKT